MLQYTNKAFINSPVASVGELPPSGVNGEIRLVISENALYQYDTGTATWTNIGSPGSGNFFADGSVPAEGDWNIAGFSLLNLGQLTSASSTGFSLLSKAPNTPGSTVFEINTLNNITDPTARLFVLRVQNVDKFVVDPTGKVVLGSGLITAGNLEIFLDRDYNDPAEKFTIYHDVSIPTPGNELFQVRANGEVEIYSGPLIGGNSPFRFESKETNGVSAIAFEFVTQNLLSNAGAKLVSIKNLTDELLVLDKDGDLNIFGDYIYNRTEADDDVLSSGERIIGVTDTTYPRTVTISEADIAIEGKKFVIKDESGSANTGNITVTCAGSGHTIDGVPYKVINTAYGSLKLYSNGLNLFTY